MEIPVRVGISPTLKTRGLIADRDIQKGEIIEECQILLLDPHDWHLADKTALTNYLFSWGDKYSSMIFGYAMLYNHSYTPNVVYIRNFEERVMVFKALRRIKKGEELFINYNGKPEDQRTVKWLRLDPQEPKRYLTGSGKKTIKRKHALSR